MPAEWPLVLLAIAAGTACAQVPPPTPAGGAMPAATGAPSGPGGALLPSKSGASGLGKPGKAAANFDDRWLGRAALMLLADAAKAGKLDDLRPRIEGLLLARMACGRPDDLDALNDLVFVHRSCRHLSAALKLPGAGGGKALHDWLLDHPAAARTLYRALEPVEKPDEGLARFAELLASAGRDVEAFPDLAAAFASTLPRQYERAQPNPAGLVESFQWYARPPSPLRTDIRRTPFELLRFLADTRLSINDRKFALLTYGRGGPPSRAYFDVNYDMDHLMQGKPRKNADVDYTLANLKRFGGVCYDQAYYASENCKAVGVPGTVVLGRGGTGVPHSWFAYFKAAPRGGTWDAQTGRYQEHLYLMGLIRDPATGKMIPDSALGAVGHSMGLPVEARESAENAVFLARQAWAASKAGTRPDTSLLSALAEEYSARTASLKNVPKAVTTWIADARTPDVATAEELINAALRLNLVCDAAWDLVVELRRSDALPPDRAGRFLAVLINQTAKSHPDYSYIVLTRLVATLPAAADRIDGYKRALDIYARTDLKCRLLMLLGDEHAAEGRPDQAAQCHEKAAFDGVKLAEIVVRAAVKAEEIHLARERREDAMNMYRRLWSQTARDPMAGIFHNQTAYYQLGEKYAGLLDAAGRSRDAEGVRKSIQ